MYHTVQSGRATLPLMGPLEVVETTRETLLPRIESELALAGAVIAEANRDEPLACSISAALDRIGTERAVAILEQIRSTHEQAKGLEAAFPTLRRIWTHTIFTAAAARHIAQKVGYDDPDSAYLIALCHSVGEPLLVYELGESALTASEAVHSPTLLIEAAGDDRRAVGALMLEAWRFPHGLIELARTWGGPPIDPLHALLVVARQAALAYGYTYLDHRPDLWLAADARRRLRLTESQVEAIPLAIADELNRVLSQGAR